MSLTSNASENKLEFKFEFEINSNKNNIFSLILSADNDSFLNIKAIQKNDLFNKSFSNEFSLDKIKENKYFIMFDDLKEICNELSDRIKTKEIKLIEKANNLIFLINLPTTKIKEITFELNEDQKNDKDQINNLNELIIKLKNEINQNKKEIKELNNKYNNEIKEIKNNYNKDINELKNIVNNQKNEINELKEQMKLWINYRKSKGFISGLESSLIIDKNIEYNELIKNWINSDKKIKGELLYRLSKDGEQISTFHNLCDDKGPTLTLFETKEGTKGGIYTPLSWDSNSSWKNHMETFIFNLNKTQRYKKIKNDYSIYCTSNYSPWTYCFGFNQANQMTKIVHGGLGINDTYEKGAEILPNNSRNTKYFDIKEVEVYKIIIY